MSQPAQLNIQEIMAADPDLKHIGEGEQVKRNHINCPAGRDTKQRLFVKKTEGKLLMYCHHCQGRGAIQGQRRFIKSSKNVVTESVLTLPPDLTTVPRDMNVHGSVWLSKYGINEAERKHYMLGWSDYHNRIILPVWNLERTELIAFQRRRILPHDTMPKYLTTRRAYHKHPVWYGSNHREGDTLVITEDILSAVKVNRVCMSLSLLGTHLPDAVLHWIVNHYSRVLLWLDDDGPAVRQHQRNIMKRLALFMDARILKTEHDPKEYHHDEIREIVNNA